MAFNGRLLLNQYYWNLGVRLFSYSKTKVKTIQAQENWRREFLKEQFEREKQVELYTLSENQRKIYELHREAANAFKFTYIDPTTGIKVLTSYRHFMRMKCCGNACRHCTYNHEAVGKERREERMFNSAFWVDKPKATTPDLEMLIQRKPKTYFSNLPKFVSPRGKGGPYKSDLFYVGLYDN